MEEKKLFDDEGNEIIAVPVEKVKEIQEQLSSKEGRIAELEEELKKGGSAREARTEELRQLREAREADSAQLRALQETIETKSKKEIELAKQRSIARFAGSNQDLAKQLEEEYGFINIPEDGPENVEKRFEKAARVLNLFKEETRSNPAFSGVSGREPYLKGSFENDKVDIGSTPEGKRLLGYLGLDEQK